MNVSVRYPKKKELKYSRMISEFIEEVEYKNQSSSKPSQVKVLRTTKLRKLITNRFSPVMMQDSHEFLLHLFNNLQDELTESVAKLPSYDQYPKVNDLWREYTRAFPSQIDRLFTAIELSHIKCGACQKETKSLQYYLTFPLQVDGLKSIDQSLKLYVTQEPLPDYKCDKCQIKKNCVLRRQIMRLPEIFVF